MISVIVYGRNDVHGYNAHRRTALSLNCIAEVLTDPDDEIVFADYNSPDELPTLIEALADTLTDRCLSQLRVLRVPARIHLQRFAARTHLPIVEPVARNAAARRANPANRWLLSTNTDMILLPLGDRSLSEICADLPDGFYGLPRFELPEWVWEHLPRTDPQTAMAEIARTGPGLRLDEMTLSHDSIRFDAPGDFQLVLRDDFFAIDGFDEEMLLGWHVDSNLSKRMLLNRGSIESLHDHVAGYHCNHNRIPTIYHSTEAANDLSRFFLTVDRVELPEQRETWGLGGVALEEVRVRERAGPDFAAAVLASTADGPASLKLFDARETKFALEYDSSHVLPFVADSLSVSPPDATIAYIGSNPVLEAMLTGLVAGLELGGPLAVFERDDPGSLAELDRIADVFVVDLGVDASLVDAPLSSADGPVFAGLRAGVVRAFDAFRRLVDLERARLEQGAHPRRFVLVNTTAVFWNEYVLAELQCGATTPHARVRHAVVKTHPDESDAAVAAQTRALRLIRWMSRRDLRRRPLELRPGETIAIGELDDYAGFGDGWAFPDTAAVWTQGPRSELSIALGEKPGEPYSLTLSFDEIAVRPHDSPNMLLFANGAPVAACDFPETARLRVGLLRAQARTLGITRVRALRWLYLHGLSILAGARRLVLRTSARATAPQVVLRTTLPDHLLANGTVDLTLVVQEPATWSDDRHRGLHLTSLAVRNRGWRQRFAQLPAASRARRSQA